METKVVTISADELERLIARAVSRGLDSQPVPMPIPEPQWLDTNEVAELLGVHPKTVPTLVKRGLPSKRLGPKTVRYERGAVLAWLASRKR